MSISQKTKPQDDEEIMNLINICLAAIAALYVTMSVGQSIGWLVCLSIAQFKGTQSRVLKN